MTFQLRPYQLDLIARTNVCLANGGVPCVTLVTGGGKSAIAAELTKQALARGEQVLITAHRLEIIKQLVESLCKHLGEMPQLITADSTTPLKKVTIAMVPTLTRRPQWIERLQGRTYMADEAHHCPAPSYVKLRERLNPGRFLGLTATPISPTGGGLGKHFTELIEGPPMRWLIDNGFLCDYLLYGAPAEIDTEGVTVRAGDYALNELEERVVKVSGNVLRDWRRFNPEGKSTICVGVSVQHAHALAQLYRDAGVAAAAVDGTTPAQQRDQIFNDFRSGSLTVLCACAVIDEGLSIPEATCLQLLRPTRSLRLYRQLAGRVLRPAENKGKAIILDHSGSWRCLPLPDEDVQWSLTEKVKQVKAEDRQVTRDDDFIVAKRESIVEDNIHLQLVSTTASIEAKRQEARRRLWKTIGLVRRNIIPDKALWNHVKDARYFSDAELLAIQQTMKFPADWAAIQSWLNMPQTPY